MPGVPNIELEADPANARVQVHLTAGAGNTPEYYEVQHSVDGGQTFVYVRRAQPAAYSGTTTTVNDYESRTHESTFYRARAYELDENENPKNMSEWSTPQSIELRVRTWWLKDPYNPERNMTVALFGNHFELKRKEHQARFRPLGRVHTVVVTGILEGHQLPTLEMTTLGASERRNFIRLYESRRTLLLQAPMARQWYIRFGDELTEKIINTTDEYHEFSINAYEQPRPGGGETFEMQDIDYYGGGYED